MENELNGSRFTDHGPTVPTDPKLTHFLDYSFGPGAPPTITQSNEVDLALCYLGLHILGCFLIEVRAICVPFQVTVIIHDRYKFSSPAKLPDYVWLGEISPY